MNDYESCQQAPSMTWIQPLFKWIVALRNDSKKCSLFFFGGLLERSWEDFCKSRALWAAGSEHSTGWIFPGGEDLSPQSAQLLTKCSLLGLIVCFITQTHESAFTTTPPCLRSCRCCSSGCDIFSRYLPQCAACLWSTTSASRSPFAAHVSVHVSCMVHECALVPAVIVHASRPLGARMHPFCAAVSRC